jgi:hypothetical protein
VREWPLLGTGRLLVPFPAWFWRKQVAQGARRLTASLAFMSEDHHRVRYFVVREIPRVAKPLAPGLIAESLELPRDRVIQILEDLERNLTFVFRNSEGAVSWAYPVTTDPTPHRVRFSTGEETSAA